MKALQIAEAGVVRVADVEKPVLKSGEILLSIKYVGFCGSDLNTYRGNNPMVKMPVIPGHEVGAVIEEIGEGRLIMGDGASYHNVVFNAVFFKPEQQEIIDGEVIEIAEFGAFVRIGPMDGLVHVSQVTDDYINYDSKRGALLAKESNKTLDEGDLVRSRIIAISLKDNSTKNTKIGLTMRQNGLGRFEWIEEAKEKSKKGKK